ncbi:putative phosphatidylserine decarboxylase [Xylaria intraflava]|nr:putative phosphatidylserine decarboxylase [Xylaria intraflava]
MAGEYAPIVQELVQAINTNKGWLDDFNCAIDCAVKQAPNDIEGIRVLEDYYKFIDQFLRWVPSETPDGRQIYKKLCLFYFILDQRSAYAHQTAISPATANQPLGWLSDWIVRYARELGAFLDTPESLTDESLQTFKDAPSYNWNDYVEPRGGWKTFNEFFARYVKPGYRPITDIANSNVIVAPADSTYQAQYPVDSDSQVTIKTLVWPIYELLNQTEYADNFKGGIFLHSFLGPNDYHRLHAPVGGEVLEAKIIQGQAYLEVIAENGRLKPIRPIQSRFRDPRDLNAPDSAGYQFCQIRGLFVLKTAIGLVAVLPIGMCQVSSVVPTAEVGRTLFKGEELAYFQFGGSDIVLVFEADSKVTVTANSGTHYKVGTQIATAAGTGSV